MVRPRVHVDEDWEIYLPDAYEDDAWEADDSQKKRYYVGKTAFEKRDRITGRVTSFRIFSGRIRLPEQPIRFHVVPDVQSPIRWDSLSVTSPSESDPSIGYDPSEESEPVDSHPVPEHKSDSKSEDVEMTTADIERNATLFLDDIRDEAGLLKEEFVEEAKDWMERFLRNKRSKSV